MATDEALLDVRDLSVSYSAVKAVKGVSFHVKKGEIVCLLGANGAGKTTILKSISRILKPTSGSIFFAGQDLLKKAAHEVVGLGLCQAPEGRGIFLNLSVLENLDLGAWAVKGKRNFRSDLDRVFELFPRLRERQSQNAGTLSGGEQQMLAIGRALMSEPKCLLLDEPSLGLAPQIMDRIFRVIQDINRQGVSILLVEQNAAKALQVASRGLVIETGVVKISDTSENLLASDEVRQAYLGQ